MKLFLRIIIVSFMLLGFSKQHAKNTMKPRAEISQKIKARIDRKVRTLFIQWEYHRYWVYKGARDKYMSQERADRILFLIEKYCGAWKINVDWAIALWAYEGCYVNDQFVEGDGVGYVQMIPSTIRAWNPSLKHLSDDEIIGIFEKDIELQFESGARHFRWALKTCKWDYEKGINLYNSRHAKNQFRQVLIKRDQIRSMKATILYIKGITLEEM